MFNKLMIPLLLVTPITQTQYSSLPVNATAQLLVALSQHFSCSSIILVSDDFPYDTWSLTNYLVNVRKRLSEEYVPSSYARGGVQRGRPLVVIMKSLEKTRAYLAKVSARNDLHDPVWVILLENTAPPITTVFRDIYVPLNSQILLIQVVDSLTYLTEVYQVTRDSPLKAQTIGTWEQNSGQRSWTMMGKYERRSNLEGLQFRVASHRPLDLLKRCEKNYNLPDCPLFTRTWSILHSSMNCSPSLFMNAPDGEWGSETSNGTWTGQAGLVVSGEVDVAADWFTVTEQRMKAMDYTSVVLSSKLYVYIGHNGLRDLEWGSFFKPLHRSVWCYVVFFTLTVPMCMTLIYHAGRKWAGAKPEPQCQTVGEALFCVFNALCQKGNDITPTGTSCRVVYLTWYIVTMILMASYSASLISILTNTRFSPPFRYFKEMLDLGTYPLLLPRGSVYPDIFKTDASHDFYPTINDECTGMMTKGALRYIPVDKQTETLPWHPVDSLSVCEGARKWL
ncbi:uncharacterized protein [Anabrus simplex]|uniref:uncharacterized protein n=1 Tax=Anabrus simplex TaxID=316456 RepID=UPI0035A33869